VIEVGVVILPQQRWALARSRWQRVEEMGFAHAWTYDHLAWRSLADEPWFATVPLLAAAAGVTSRIGLGTFVASPNFRHPVPFAKDVMGLDDVTGGRLLLGLGAGGEGFDAEVMGPAPTRGERTARFAEFIELMDQLLTSPVTEHTGRFYTAHAARMNPGTIARPRPPFVVAAAGPRAMALAARFGQGWVTYGPNLAPQEAAEPDAQQRWWTGLAEQCAAMDRIEQAAGRSVPLRRYLSLDGAPVYGLTSLDVALEGIERAAGLGFTDVVVHWPRDSGVYAGSPTVLEELAGRLPRR
jgi:alkanesulfonate monooxygenase SsuD/methylene tetrahydromethanopterin reductase-like flavin-dependent oxidoreductase (luciferase family)